MCAAATEDRGSATTTERARDIMPVLDLLKTKCTTVYGKPYTYSGPALVYIIQRIG